MVVDTDPGHPGNVETHEGSHGQVDIPFSERAYQLYLYTDTYDELQQRRC